MIYLVNNQGKVATYFNEETLIRHGFTLSQALQITEEQYSSVGGESYIDEHGRITLGIEPKIARQKQLRDYKQFLSSTDYIDNKIIEGEATVDDYKDIIAQRKEARAKIRELEKEGV